MLFNNENECRVESVDVVADAGKRTVRSKFAHISK
jgi:hypothetical protein